MEGGGQTGRRGRDPGRRAAGWAWAAGGAEPLRFRPLCRAAVAACDLVPSCCVPGNVSCALASPRTRSGNSKVLGRAASAVLTEGRGPRRHHEAPRARVPHAGAKVGGRGTGGRERAKLLRAQRVRGVKNRNCVELEEWMRILGAHPLGAFWSRVSVSFFLCPSPPAPPPLSFCLRVVGGGSV